MEFILHFLGVCHDTHTHIDLIDLVVLLGGSSLAYQVKLYFNTLMFIIKDYFNKSNQQETDE